MGNCSSFRKQPLKRETKLGHLSGEESKTLPPIVYYDLDDLKMLGRFPRSPENKVLQNKLMDIDRNDAGFIFLSHCWVRGYSGAEGWDGRPHPDTATHDKMQLTIEACEKMRKTHFHGVSKVYLWLDYGCIDQDASACLELKMLDKIIASCDMVLTPIHDKGLGDWFDEIIKKGITNMFDQYGSPAWKEGMHSYLNRGWCRVEMMYATNIPLMESSPERLSKLSPLLRQRRVQVIYGSNEQKRNMQPVVLPPMNNSWFDMYSPEKGNLTKESDRVHVKRLVDQIRHLITKTEEKYEGEYNEEGQRHGKGTYTFANGDIYEGDYRYGKKHGKGTMTYASGDIYEGDFKDGKKHGKGTFTYATGNIYEGDFKDDKRHGKGTYTYASGDIYEGDWKDGNYHGKGKETFASGNIYEGDYKDGKRHGKGTYTYASGDIYEGDFKDGKRNGKGTFTFANGDIYEGDFKDGNFHGKGVFRGPDGTIIHSGDWKDDKSYGESYPLQPEEYKYYTSHSRPPTVESTTVQNRPSSSSGVATKLRNEVLAATAPTSTSIENFDS